MKDNNNPIGIFDSGVGGLTVLSELQKLLPNESFIYVADQTYMPYSEKTTKELQNRTEKIVNFLTSKKAKIIVIACNTATVSAIDYLRKKFNVPIVGVVPVVKTASEKTKTENIAVFATSSTIKSAYLNDLIRKFTEEITVYKEGETKLEMFIEKGDLDNPLIEDILEKHFMPLKKKGVDVIALGCTHYPFLKEKMQEVVGKKILLLDSGGAVARHTKRILEHNNSLSGAKKQKDWYYTTGDKAKFENVIKKLLKKSVKAKQINL